jgi:glucosamine--fructose-6-phosphate aminotransferase (isomerizing)
LEYRGYDSAGVAVVRDSGDLVRSRALGKVIELTNKLAVEPIDGKLGIAHTRWATHGVPAERNAHPHFSGEWVGLVHNGIIENHAELRKRLQDDGYSFTSDTDTEVVAHLIEVFRRQGISMLDAVMAARCELQGAYALSVISPNEPDTLIVARQGSPLVIGLGIGENFIGSDIQALLPVTSRFIYLENGDVAKITRHKIDIYDSTGERVTRPMKESSAAMCSGLPLLAGDVAPPREPGPVRLDQLDPSVGVGLAAGSLDLDGDGGLDAHRGLLGDAGVDPGGDAGLVRRRVGCAGRASLPE